jgi:hypothetical protein
MQAAEIRSLTISRPVNGFSQDATEGTVINLIFTQRTSS